MEEEILGMMMGGLAIITLFIGLPWLVFHYITKWKTAATLTGSDEKLLDDRTHHDCGKSSMAAAMPAGNRSPTPPFRRKVTSCRNRQAERNSIATSAMES
jgi:hypothetical protein